MASSSAVPRPDQIFDFHPRGSSADSWRQPFIVDVNDGPLRNYVKQTAAELKAFKEDQARPSVASTMAPAQKARPLPACGPAKEGGPKDTPCLPPRPESSAQLKQ